MTVVLVVAPHPDDEVLGPGGTLARHAEAGHEVHVAIATRAQPPIFVEQVATTGRIEARRAHDVLGVTETHFFDFPAAQLDTVPHAELNAAFETLVAGVRPDELYLPFPGDIHRDHQLVFASALVAARPGAGAPARICAYETLSETNWNAPKLAPSFIPQRYVDISDSLEAKIEALRCYASQLKPFPAERSVDAVRNLAGYRGATVGLTAAEAFVVVREVA